MSSPVPLPPRPRPVVTTSAGGARLVPANWLDEAPVTRALLTLNVAVFVMQVALAHQLAHLPVREALELGASYGLATVGEYRWETLLTACFLHDGIVHLGFNMLALWQAGPLVERAVGSARMAPLYLAAGVFGNVLSVGYDWITRSAGFSVGASGAISGVVAAAVVVGWRVQGWRGPLTQTMLRWLAFVIGFGVLSNLSGGRIDNAAHVGGAVAGAGIALLWRMGRRYSEPTATAILGACAVVLVACIGVVAFHDRTDPFATSRLQEREDFTREALEEGRCSDAESGLLAVERLRARMAPVTSLRSWVETTCGHGLVH